MGYGKTDQNAFAVNKKFWKVPEGGAMVYFCPPWAEAERKPFREWTIHYGVTDHPIACFKQFGHATCPICDANTELYSQKNNAAAQQLSKEIYGKKSYTYNLIADVKVVNSTTPGLGILTAESKVVDGQVVEPEVKMYGVSPTLHKMIGSFFAFHGDIFNPEAGNAIMLAKVGNKNEIARIQPTPHPMKVRLDEKLMKLLDTMHNLNNCYEAENIDGVRELLNVKLASVRNGNIYSVPQPQPQQQYNQPQYQMPQQQPQYPQPTQQQAPQQHYAAQTVPVATSHPVPQVTVPAATQQPASEVVPQVAAPEVNSNQAKLDQFEEFLKLQKAGLLPTSSK